MSAPVLIRPDGLPDDNRTLAWAVLDWMDDNLLQPDGPDAGDRWHLTGEQFRFLMWWYALDDNGRFIYRRGVLRRAKGWGKDPLAASISCVEFLGPCRFGGWYDDGTPIVVPHPAPWIQIAAVSRDQNKNTTTLINPMLRRSTIDEHGVDLGKEVIHSRAGGRIEVVTSAPRSLEGSRPSLMIMSETQHWLASNDGHEMAKAIARNLAKGRDGAARSLALTNAHDPGEDSVAEHDWEAFEAIRDGRSIATGLLYDSREAPPTTELANRDSLRAGLLAARGDSKWLDVDRLIEEAYDPATPPSMTRRFYLNQLTASEDAWLTPGEWAGCADPTAELHDNDVVTLGFDGAVREDSTALVACRVEDAHIELLGCWEKPDLVPDGWQVDREAVDAAVFQAFERFKVLGFYADPWQWQDYVDRWAAEFARRVRIRASSQRPLEWWTNRPKTMADALARFHEAVVTRALTHDGDRILTRHALNATSSARPIRVGHREGSPGTAPGRSTRSWPPCSPTSAALTRSPPGSTEPVGSVALYGF